MTKALLLLKELKKEGVKRWYYGYIDAAISELKELSKPKSCSICKYKTFHSYTDYKKDAKIYECKLKGGLFFNENCDGLVCNKYELKEQL